MANTAAEIIDTFFNGRPAPVDVKTIRVRLNREQLEKLGRGEQLLFKVKGTMIMVVAR